MPVAEEAARYYKSGKPFLHNYLPYWAANFVDRTLILLIPVFGVLIPAIKFAPILYTYRLKSRIGRWYEQLAEVEVEMSRQTDPARVGGYVRRLDLIEAEINATNMPNWLSEQMYLLRAAIDLVRERLETQEGKVVPGSPDAPVVGVDLGTPGRVA
jgi:hypothetical protein